MVDWTYVVPSITIDDATLTAASVAEPASGEAVYDDDHTYAFGDLAISTTTHRVYRSLQDTNVGKPLPVAPAKATEWWRDIGPTNRWAMLDLFSTTATVGASPLSISFSPTQRYSAFGATGVIADSVTLSVSVDDVEQWTRTVNLRRRVVRTWLEWKTTPFESAPDVLVLNIPGLIGSVLTVTFNRSSGPVRVTQAMVGRQIAIGQPPSSGQPAVSDIEDFSKSERDAYGTLERVPGKTIPKLSMTVIAERSYGRRVSDARKALAGRPAMWVGLEDLNDAYGAAMFLIGIYRRWVITLGESDLMTQEIDMEGL